MNKQTLKKIAIMTAGLSLFFLSPIAYRLIEAMYVALGFDMTTGVVAFPFLKTTSIAVGGVFIFILGLAE